MVKERLKIYLFYFIILPKFICQSSIIVFNSYQYRSGHFAFTSNGDMIVEYSYNKNRLFYGLDKNGKYYFKNSDQSKVPTKEITLSFNNNNAYRYEARNIFVTIDNKEYLFSIATHSSVVELFDLHDAVPVLSVPSIADAPQKIQDIHGSNTARQERFLQRRQV